MKTYDRIKRIVDITAAAVGLVVLAPVQGALALVVAIKLGRPVFFRQVRPGLHGRTFELVKFRSMRQIDPDAGLITDADRLTSFGKTLRATSLDELPTLWNVLRGDMSLVGPRPLLVKYLALYTPDQARRHDVRPGLTGLVQTTGRNTLSWPEKLALDVHYVEHRGPRMDGRILVKTAGAVLLRKGISADGEATMPEFTGSAAAS